MKIQSSFKFKGETYKVFFEKHNGKFFPIIKKLATSFLNIKIWMDYKRSKQELSHEDVVKIQKAENIDAIRYLKEYASNSFGKNVLIY